MVIHAVDTFIPPAYTRDVDELIAAILASIAECLLEIILELIAAAVLEVLFRVLSGLFKGLANAIKDSRAAAGLTYGVLGVLAGKSSLLVLPYPLINRQHQIGFHGVSLLVSPVGAGLVLSAIGAALRRRGKRVSPIETFGYGFTFALGMAIIRFFFAR